MNDKINGFILSIEHNYGDGIEFEINENENNFVYIREYYYVKEEKVYRSEIRVPINILMTALNLKMMNDLKNKQKANNE